MMLYRARPDTPEVAYLAAPYRAGTLNGIRENIRLAEQAATMLWERGYYVFCPHMNSAFFDGLVPDKVFLEAGKEFLRRSDLLVLVGEWVNSAGCWAEVRVAISREMPVCVLVNDKLFPLDLETLAIHAVTSGADKGGTK